MIIDTHIHLEDERYADDFDAVLARARAAGVSQFVLPGADPKTLKRAVALCETHEGLYFALGVHPYDMEAFASFSFEPLIRHPKCVAVGECGLDYYRLEGDEGQKQEEKARQHAVFRAQIRMAIAYHKPLIVHIRDASHDAKTILLEEGAEAVGGVLHCYNADAELLMLAKSGFYFGIGGVVTFKNARKLLEVLPKIPKDRLLIETDGPYLTPHPHRGERNEPAYCTLVAQKMAELLECSLGEIEATTTANAQKLFRI